MAAAVNFPSEPASAATLPQRAAQPVWAVTPVAQRLSILRRARHLLAAQTDALTGTISPELSRNRADTLVAEVLPLLEACRFLERSAAKLLSPRTLGRHGRPVWLSGVDTVVERVPFGIVLVIAPSNYPLLLAGVQTLQALAAGNAVVWKPGRGGASVAHIVASALTQAGLPDHLLHITGESVADAQHALAAAPDKVIFTGSAEAGREVAHAAADLGIPMVAELSGCDAVAVLPSADAAMVADALCFGMRLNGSATCMAPRRLFLLGNSHEALLPLLRERFAAMDPVPLAPALHTRLTSLLADAVNRGATIQGQPLNPMRPLLIEQATPDMQIARADIIAPVLSVLRVHDAAALLAAERACPFGLTFAIFGEEAEALRLGHEVTAGTILVNDLIVPTADPRVPFGGRRGSGYGVTRGAEGLLEMTAPRTVSVRQGKTRRHFEQTGAAHEALFQGMIALTHGGSLKARWHGLRALLSAGRTLSKRNKQESGT